MMRNRSCIMRGQMTCHQALVYFFKTLNESCRGHKMERAYRINKCRDDDIPGLAYVILEGEIKTG